MFRTRSEDVSARSCRLSALLTVAFVATALAALPFAAGAVTAPDSSEQPDFVVTDFVVTDDGRLLHAVTGTYAELFPGSTEVAASASVLAVDLQFEDSTERMLMPTSEDWQAERSPFLIYDTSSQTTILQWQAEAANGLSTPSFATFIDGEWSDVDSPRDSDGDIVRFSAEPQVFLTSNQLTFAHDDQTVTLSRQVAHYLWRDDDTETLFYMPLVFVDGQYVGWTDVVNLRQLASDAWQASQTPADENDDTGDAEDTGNQTAPIVGPTVPTDGLSEDMRKMIRTEQVGDRLIISFADIDHEQLAVVKVELVPMALTSLGDDIQQRVLDSLDSLANPEGIQSLSEEMLGQIIAVGHTFNMNPAITEYTSVRVAQWISEHGSEYAGDRVGLARALRELIVDIGLSVASTHTESTDASDSAAVSDTVGDQRLRDLVRLDVTAHLAAPTVVAPGLVAHLQPEGHGMALAWLAEESTLLLWTKNVGDGWSQIRSVRLSEGLSAEQAHELVRRRIR